MKDDLREFGVALWKHWRIIVTGSGLAVGLAFAGLFGVQFPLWIAWLVLVSSLLTACYLAWRDEFRNVKERERRLVPRLAIHSVPQSANGVFRIEVRNLSGLPVQFRALLESADQPLSVALPIRLPATHHEPGVDAEIPAGGAQLVDVFFADRAALVVLEPRQVTRGDDPAAIFLSTSPTVRLPRKQYEIRICAFPVLPEGGTPARRSFYIIPQRDGSIIFGDAGKAS